VPGSQLRRGAFDRLPNPAVGTAPAHVHDLVDVGIRGVPVRAEQRRGLHDLPGLAEAALRHVLVELCLLYGVQPALGSQALDRGDLLSHDIGGSEGADLNRFAVHVAGARATDADSASILGSGHTEQVAQHPERGISAGASTVTFLPLRVNA
jgi:hypothetical protein